MAKDSIILARRVLESCGFLSLSDKAVRLYVHLNLDADGLGAIRTAIPMMLTKADEGHLQELIDAGFLYKLEDLQENVCLIAHWFAMNKLDRDKSYRRDYTSLVFERYGFDDASSRVYVPKDTPGCVEIQSVLEKPPAVGKRADGRESGTVSEDYYKEASAKSSKGVRK